MAVQLDKGTSLFSLSLTPLIDVVFLLLIFFLVATKFAEDERELDVFLPEASEAQPLTEKPREMFINIDAEGRYFVTGKILGLDELSPVLKAAWVNNPARASVIIRADRRCRWQHVVAAMNACLQANIHDYRVTTQEGKG
ncbi:MAG: biopolymer transporter ExbD [Planctomycetota bacterium]